MKDHRLKLHLSRRAGFGMTSVEIKAARNLSFPQLVERYLEDLHSPILMPEKSFDPYRKGATETFLIERLISGEAPLREKLALFWHDHFATSNAKVIDRRLMWDQYQLFRQFGSGRFPDLVKKMARDVAMLRWLDGNSNRKSAPNENFARELMELFTLGVGNYTEEDVKEAARAFTGWSCSRRKFVFEKRYHDAGAKKVLGKQGHFGGDEVIDIICKHPACSRYIAKKLISYFALPNPSKEYVERVALAYRKSNQRIDATLKALFLDRQFKRPECFRCLVKSPIELVATSLRVTGQFRIPASLNKALKKMGQVFFYPPSVEGWTSGVQWLSAGALVERIKWAHLIGRSAPRLPMESICHVALDGDPEPELMNLLDTVPRVAHWSVVLGSPQFQLS